MNFIALEPVEEWHTNLLLKGNGNDVSNLPATRIDQDDFQGIHSVWFCRSLRARIMFLIFGKISFATKSDSHPPVLIGIGNFVGKKPDEI